MGLPANVEELVEIETKPLLMASHKMAFATVEADIIAEAQYAFQDTVQIKHHNLANNQKVLNFRRIKMNLEINGKTIEVKFTIGAIRELDKRYQIENGAAKFGGHQFSNDLFTPIQSSNLS